MNKTMMEILACPIDKNHPLELFEIKEKNDVVIEGAIFCPKCSRFYPIMEEIPIMLPDDLIVSKSYNSKGQLKSLDKIDDTDLILDIGENTIKRIFKIIDKSKTILWNGPAGYFEEKEFSEGTNKIAKKISEKTKNKSLISVAGG